MAVSTDLLSPNTVAPKQPVLKQPALHHPVPNQPAPHILIVDDDASIRFLLSTFFTKSGYHVSVASSGIEALACFKTAAAPQPVDVVLLDMKMPGMDGIEVREELRQISDVPVLVLSGVGEDEALMREAGLKPTDFIRKPFSVRAVEERVKMLLGSLG